MFQSRKVIGQTEAAIPLLFGILSAFIFSYLAIAWLLQYLRQQSTWVFVWYRLAFGAAILGAIRNRLAPALASQSRLAAKLKDLGINPNSSLSLPYAPNAC